MATRNRDRNSDRERNRREEEEVEKEIQELNRLLEEMERKEKEGNVHEIS